MLKIVLPKGARCSTAFIEHLLTAAVEFKPDFALTINHLGLDRQGEIATLFEKMALPLASWFVDNPRLILHDFPKQANPWCALFTWNQDTVAPLTALGFELVDYLPLATDTEHFKPGVVGKPAWRSPVSFVGDSMVRPVSKLLNRLKPWPQVLDLARQAASGFASSCAGDSLKFMRTESPALFKLWEELPDPLRRLDLEQFLTWEATRLYRLQRVSSLLPFSPLIAGDSGWRSLLPRGSWKLLGPLDYYRDLPGFYPLSEVNFNATSLQMKGAVNQRVFDVPACGGFLLSDWREQMKGLFEPGKETACYGNVEEIGGLVRHFLNHPDERLKIVSAARNRVLAEHDYTHRMKHMLKTLRRRYA
ncbi:MAG: glycosyltransferase [Desulfovibrio sp.]|nr:glycosyltransferase [Desulfovibrio sp.]